MTCVCEGKSLHKDARQAQMGAYKAGKLCGVPGFAGFCLLFSAVFLGFV